MESGVPGATFGWRDWFLVGGIIVAFLVVPFIIVFRPPTWVSYRFAFLILPTIPAVLLGVLAVWAATQS